MDGCGSGSLYRYLVALSDDAVVLVHVDENRSVFLKFKFGVHGITGDDENIARLGLVCRRAIHGYHARTSLGPNGVRGETLAIGDVVNIDLLILLDIGCIQQIIVNRAGAFVMQLGVRDMHPVQLGFKHDSLHETPLNQWAQIIQHATARVINRGSIVQADFDIVDQACIAQLRRRQHH
jgi:hypothetical protein